MAPRFAKMAPKYLFSKWPLMRQDGLKMAQNMFCFNMAAIFSKIMPRDGLRKLQDGPILRQDYTKWRQDEPKWSLMMNQDGWLQDGLRWPQDGSKMS